MEESIGSILIKNQCNQNDYITQGNLHIQCNSNSMQFKLLMAFFTELEKKICMETQKTPNSQNNLEKEK